MGADPAAVWLLQLHRGRMCCSRRLPG